MVMANLPQLYLIMYGFWQATVTIFPPSREVLSVFGSVEVLVEFMTQAVTFLTLGVGAIGVLVASAFSGLWLRSKLSKRIPEVVTVS
jgi:hypothetical protein